MERLAVLASGKGSDFQSILDHIRLSVLRGVEAVLLISNNPEAYVLERARKAGVKAEYIEGIIGKKFPDKEARRKARAEFDATVLDVLKHNKATCIALAGFNQIVSPVIIDNYRLRIMNIHPAYDTRRYGGVGMVGEKVHEAVLANRERYSGCTVHYVDYTVDLGPVILRQRVPVKKSDTVRSLADRILVWEHRAYSKAIQVHVDEEFGRRSLLSEADLLKDDWEKRWNERQKLYLEYQRKHALDMYGRPLNDIL
ncbi:MAG: phosphoribosylglycinamide formyltransferase [Nitrososphaerales archaeon]